MLSLWRSKWFSLEEGGERIFMLLLVYVRWQSMPQSLQNNSKRQSWSYLTDKQKGDLPNRLSHNIAIWHRGEKRERKKEWWWFNYGWKYSCLDTAEHLAVPVSSCSHHPFTTSKHTQLCKRWRLVYGSVTMLRSESSLNDVMEAWCNSYPSHRGSHWDYQCQLLGINLEFPADKRIC